MDHALILSNVFAQQEVERFADGRRRRLPSAGFGQPEPKLRFHKWVGVNDCDGFEPGK